MVSLGSSTGRGTIILAADRQQRIIDRLHRDGQVNASSLAEEFGTSEDTIRRDLRNFASQGICWRVYGGAISIFPASAPVLVRAGESLKRKEALGRALVNLLRPKQFVYIDASSTNLAVARAIPKEFPLTAATHGPAIAVCLLGRPSLQLLVIGGRIDPEVGAAVGGRSMQEAARMRPDLLILGACSIDAAMGLGAFNYEDTQMKGALIEAAGSTAVAVLNKKLGAAATYKIADTSCLRDVVVEADAPLSALEFSTQGALRIHRAGPVAGNMK